jgi:hypothetical protein
VTSPDDLTPLLTEAPPGPGYDLRFRSGVVVSWNPLTAENVVRVGGTEVADLPILNTSEALLLAAGDVVGVLAARNERGSTTYAILGRMTIPGTASAATAINALGNAIVVATEPNQQSTTSSSYTDLTTVGPEMEVLIRPSGRCLFIYGCYMIQVGIAFGHMDIVGDGPGGDSFTTTASGASLGAGTGMAGNSIEGTSTNARLLTGLDSGMWTVTAKYKSGGGLGNPSVFMDRFLIAIPL